MSRRLPGDADRLPLYTDGEGETWGDDNGDGMGELKGDGELGTLENTFLFEQIVLNEFLVWSNVFIGFLHTHNNANLKKY